LHYLFYILNSIQPPVRSSKLHYWPLAFTKKNGTFWDKLGHFGTPGPPSLARSLFILYFAYVRAILVVALAAGRLKIMPDGRRPCFSGSVHADVSHADLPAGPVRSRMGRLGRRGRKELIFIMLRIDKNQFNTVI
jgi:hypothetical protein